VRLFDPRDRQFDLDTLGFDNATLKGLLRLLKRSNGLLLFTGPTGSGKTITMYSALCHITQRDGASISISTVEDPVEFNLPMVSQTQINNAQGFTYAIALRSIMRQDRLVWSAIWSSAPSIPVSRRVPSRDSSTWRSSRSCWHPVFSA
jgi:type II secretory ATPase GspE/PulE/Tfp pilus assembly ATPase PilB-like protein